MSNLNLTWLKENMPEKPIIFDIGCANLNDTLRIKQHIPDATLYAFECSDDWHDNKEKARKNNINYYHVAVSDTDGIVTFYPSNKLDDQDWPWSGSVCSPSDHLLNERWEWGDPYSVESITLNTFCSENNIKPHFIHVDAQGAEYQIFLNLDKALRPIAIWAEVSEFNCYNTGVTLNDFNNLLADMGYNEMHKGQYDSLYILENYNLTRYHE